MRIAGSRSPSWRSRPGPVAGTAFARLRSPCRPPWLLPPALLRRDEQAPCRPDGARSQQTVNDDSEYADRFARVLLAQLWPVAFSASSARVAAPPSREKDCPRSETML